MIIFMEFSKEGVGGIVTFQNGANTHPFLILPQCKKYY